MSHIAIVTGSNRGLGLECVKMLAQQGHQVIMTARDAEKGNAVSKQLNAEGLKNTFMALDISSLESIHSFVTDFQKKFDRVDVLINNAGIYQDPRDGGSSSPAMVLETFRTNTLGAYALIQELLPLMKKNNFGRVVNVSSGMGALTDMGGDSAAYRISKTALNAVTKIYAEQCRGTNVLVNAVCPGWVHTDMGGAAAPRTLEQGAKSILWGATIPNDGPTGGFYRDGKSLAW